MRRRCAGPAVLLIFLLVLFRVPGALAFQRGEESVQESVCRIIESSARAQDLPVSFVTRLVWQESSFRADAVSPAGAQGIAQFMPRTAGERGLVNPFDPEQAIPKAAELLADLKRRFGNLGLAAAAYNAGPTRVADWIAGKGGLPMETRNYVQSITGRLVDDWRGPAADETRADVTFPADSCLQVVASIRRSDTRLAASSTLLAPWGVQLSGNFSKSIALASYARARSEYFGILGSIEPMIIGTRLRSRGTRPFYRVRAPAPTRAAAIALCNRIHQAGGACVVLRS